MKGYRVLGNGRGSSRLQQKDSDAKYTEIKKLRSRIRNREEEVIKKGMRLIDTFP